jgi:hypothetical protein
MQTLTLSCVPACHGSMRGSSMILFVKSNRHNFVTDMHRGDLCLSFCTLVHVFSSTRGQVIVGTRTWLISLHLGTPSRTKCYTTMRFGDAYLLRVSPFRRVLYSSLTKQSSKCVCVCVCVFARARTHAHPCTLKKHAHAMQTKARSSFCDTVYLFAAFATRTSLRQTNALSRGAQMATGRCMGSIHTVLTWCRYTNSRTHTYSRDFGGKLGVKPLLLCM